MRGGEALEENQNEKLTEEVSEIAYDEAADNETSDEGVTAKRAVISGNVLWVALGACVIWLISVGVMLILKLTEPPIPPNMIDYTCELAVDIPAEPVIPEKKKPTILAEYKELYEKNHDMVGWLKIDGTNVDYPVMQSKGFDPTKPLDYSEIYDKNMYYMRHDFNKEYSYSGSITAEYTAHIESDYHSANILLHGHNMSNGTFFRDVSKFDVLYYGRDMYDEHPVVQFDTLYEKGLYKIFAMMQVNTNSEDGEVFYYTLVHDFKNKKEFIDYYAQVLDRSFIYTPQVDLKYGDEVIAMSTCDFTFGKSKSLRFVLFARKVRDGEDPTVDVSQTIINYDPLYYDYWYSAKGGAWGGRNWDPALLKGYSAKKS